MGVVGFNMKEKKEFTKKDMNFIMGENGLKRYYKKINSILKYYMDLDKEYYSLVSCWILGTYFHKQFPSYPYLFFNAMKGSGKTRMLKIISNLAKNGKLVGSMTPAVLFRTAKLRTLCLDEIEGINAKGNENLKLLLNSAYKRGLSVERMSKRKTADGEEQVVEEFEVFCPIVMANIWGLGNVLADRSVSLILERSSKASITKLIENFEEEIEFKTTKGGMERLTENLKDDQGLFSHIFSKWNVYHKNVVSKVSIVSNVNIVNIVNNKGKADNIDNIDNFTTLFDNIDKVNLSGRDLELFLPLFIIADMIDPEILKELLKTSKTIVKLRKERDQEENLDVKIYEFVAQSNYVGYIETAQVVKDLREYYGEEESWINSRGISRALNRLKLILNRRSTGKKRQVKLNIEKAQEKLLIFKEPEEIKKIIKEEVDFTKLNLGKKDE
jgi:hypothetical protein